MTERSETSIRQFLESSLEDQNEVWYDWFCSDKALMGKTKSLVPRIRNIVRLQEKLVPKNRKVDIDNMYVWFKNNCPCSGSLYDDFRFASRQTGDVIFTITPSSGHKVDFGIAEVWGKSNDFKEALVKGTWKDVLDYFRR